MKTPEELAEIARWSARGEKLTEITGLIIIGFNPDYQVCYPYSRNSFSIPTELVDTIISLAAARATSAK